MLAGDSSRDSDDPDVSPLPRSVFDWAPDCKGMPEKRAASRAALAAAARPARSPLTASFCINTSIDFYATLDGQLSYLCDITQEHGEDRAGVLEGAQELRSVFDPQSQQLMEVRWEAGRRQGTEGGGRKKERKKEICPQVCVKDRSGTQEWGVRKELGRGAYGRREREGGRR